VDVEMPEMDGFEFVEAVRKDTTVAGTPLILLTSSGHRGDASRCRKLGVAGYLPKPISAADLLDAVHAIVGRPTGHHARQLVTQHSLREKRRALRVLVAEDDVVNRRLTTRLLEKRGHTAVAVADGLRAVAAFQQERFDVVLMDVQMPDMDGLEATQCIRAAEAGASSRTPVIALTAHALLGDRRRCLEAGMDSYLVKPIDAALLFETVESAASAAREGAGGASPAPVLDAEAALQRVGGDPGLLSEVARLLREDAPGAMRDIADALERRDGRALERAAHRLKGSLGLLSAAPAADAALALERDAREGDFVRAALAHESLRREMERLAPELDCVVEGAAAS
jgi:CheY-like chemotaxis protein/HPt (histidine-containing phosphotransfer) domain-containing protein